MTTLITITREDLEIEVEVSDDDTTLGYVDKATGSFAVDQEIPLTCAEMDEAMDRLMAARLSQFKRECDEWDAEHDYTPREMDAAGDRYFSERLRK